jgi:hypothetical protein
MSRMIAQSAGATKASRRGAAGIGVADYIELNTGFSRERANVTVHRDRRIDLVLGHAIRDRRSREAT